MPEVFKNGAWQPYDGPVSTEPPPPPSSMLRRVAGDTAVSALKGAIGLPEAAVGLADIPTGGRAGLLAEKAGVKFKESKEILDTLYSPEQQAANARVSEAKGFVPTLTTMLQNPSTVYHAAVESAPSIVGGYGVAKGFLRLAPKAVAATRGAQIVAGAAGEGAVTAGSSAEGIRQQTEDGTLTAKQSALAAGTGAVTSLLGVAGGKVAQRLGIADIDNMFLTGGASQGTKKNVIRRLAEGVVSEGAFEELPQSAQEQAAQNLALGRPVGEGVAEAAASGLLVGGAMGGGVAAVSGKGKKVEKKDPVHQAVLDTLLEKATGAETPADDIISAKVAEATTPEPVTSQFGDEIPGEAAASRVSQFGETASDPWALRTPETQAPAAVTPEGYLGDLIPEQANPLTPSGAGRQEVLNPEVAPLTPETEMEKSQREWLGGASLGQYATKEALYRDALQRTGTPEGARAWMKKIYETETTQPLAAQMQASTSATVDVTASTETKIPDGVTKSHYLAGVKEANASVLTEGLDNAVQKYKDMTAQLHDTGPDSVVTRREQSVLRAYKDVLSGYGAYVGEERRSNLSRRSAIGSMTPAELRKEVLTSHTTGLPNQRAYDEAPRKKFQVVADADNLKWYNTHMGMDKGTAMLRAIGKALQAETPDSYHISGDEFILEADTKEEAQAMMGRISQRLANEELKHVGSDGKALAKKGFGISYGIGTSLKDAEENMKAHKKTRTQMGQRADRFGQPPGVVKFSMKEQTDANQEYKNTIQDGISTNTPAEGSATAEAAKRDDLVRFSREAFFSKVKDLVESKMGGSMPLAQLKTMLKNNGATDDEITQTLSGLEGKEKVTKAEVLEEIQANGVELTDVVLGEKKGREYKVEPNAEETDYTGHEMVDVIDPITGYTRFTGKPSEAQEWIDTDHSVTATETPTQFESYQEPGAKEGSYREMFVTAPDLPKTETEVLRGVRVPVEVRKDTKGDWYLVDSRGEWGTTPFKDEESATQAMQKIRETSIQKVSPSWQDGHSQYSDIQNPVVRIRFNEREADGKNLIFIEEMQGPSDAEQAKMPEYLKKRIYDLGVKRVLAYAKANGFDGISWTPGAIQAKRWGTERIDWASKNGKFLVSMKEQEGGNAGGMDIEAEARDRGQLLEENGTVVSTKEELLALVQRNLREGKAEKVTNKLWSKMQETEEGTYRPREESFKDLYDKMLTPMFKKYGKEGVGEISFGKSDTEAQDIIAQQIFHRNYNELFPGQQADVAAHMQKRGVDVKESLTAPYIPITQKTPETYPLFSRGADNGRANRNDDQGQADQTPVGDRGLPRPGDGRNEAGRESLLSGVDLDLSRALGSYYNDRVPPGAAFRVSGAPLQLGVEKVAKAFGVSVVVFDSVGGRGPNGFNVEGRIYINAKTKNQHLAIFGHELVHSMQEYAPDIYADLERVAIANGMTMSETLREETLGDYVGNKLTQKQFWDRLANAAPESFRIVLGYVRAMLAKVKGLLKSSNAALASDFQEIEDAAVSALTRFAKRRNMTVKEVENGFLKSGNIVLQQRIERSKEASGLAAEASEAAKQDPYFVRMSAAWHGSPHDFDAFKTSQIGTGEGAQAYGHGLYFTENKQIAEFYRDKLASTELTYKGEKYLRGGYFADQILYDMGIEIDPRGVFEQAANISAADKVVGRNKNTYTNETQKAIYDYVQANIETPKASLFSVELAPKESEYLLWDKPLSAQSETVKKALESVGVSTRAWVDPSGKPVGGMTAFKASADPEYAKSLGLTKTDTDVTGDEFYRKISKAQGGKSEGSTYLHSLGIRGIKYLDGSSRAEGEGNYNYVIFNDEDVTITAKFSRETLNTVGEKLRPQMEAMKNLAAKGLRVMAPLDRAIDLHLSQKLYAPLHGLLLKYKDIKRMGDYIQNTMLTKAYGMYDDTLKAAGFESNWLKKNSPEAQKNMETFHQVVNHGTLAQIFPDKPLAEQPWATKLFGDLDGEMLHTVKRTDKETGEVVYEARYYDDKEALAVGATLEEALENGEVTEVFTKKKAGKRTTVALVDGTQVEAIKTKDGWRVLKKQTPSPTTGKVTDTPVKAVRLKDGTWQIRRVVAATALAEGATREEALKNAGSEEITERHEWDLKGMPEKTGYKTLTEAHDVLSRAYKSLPESLRKQYQSKQAQLKEFTDAYVVALRDRILAGTETGEAQNALLAQIDRRFKLKGPYAPLMRYGDFVLNVYDKQGGTRRARYQYDTTTTRADAERQILADNPEYWLEKSTRQQWSRAESNIPTAFIDAMNEIITASGANQEVANGILADMEQLWFSHAPETSVMKHSMRRTGLAGFDTDSLRAHLSYTSKIARATSALVYGAQQKEVLDGMQATLQDITKAGGDPTKLEGLVQYLKDQDNAVRSERINPLIRKISAVPFLWYLSSPSTFIVQSTQPFAFAFPHLAARGYGVKASFDAITRGYKNQVDGKFTTEMLEKYTLTAEKLIELNQAGDEAGMKALTQGMTADELKLLALRKGELDGTFNISQTHEALDVIANRQRSRMNDVMQKASWFMRISELGSRKSVFAASFDLEYAKSKDFEKSLSFARSVVDDTLFNYNQSNRSMVLTGNMGRLIGQFRTYQFNAVYKLIQLSHDSLAGLTPEDKKTARKELAFLVGAVGAMAGATGLPFAAGMFAALSFLFGSDDDPFDAEEEFASLMRDALGDTLGGAALKGLPALVGMDISNRVGMGGLFSIVNSEPPENLHGADLYNWYVGKLSGPTGGVITGGLRAVQSFERGDMYGAVRNAMPRPIADLAKTIQTIDQGQTASGRTIQGPDSFTPMDWALVAVGLNPIKMSLAAEEQRTVTQANARITERKKELSQALARAVVTDDSDSRDAITEDIQRFNEKMPGFAFTSRQLANAVKREMDMRNGVVPKREQRIQEMM
jgi:GGDEF domain-containing protein/translation initiation factor 1 (eIF-1/SUI1)